MTTYQDVPYSFVDSPLNQPEDDSWVAYDYGWQPADPMAAFAASGYLQRIAADRVGGTQAGWGA